MKMQKIVSLLFLVCAIGVLTSSKFGYGNIIGGHGNKSCIKGEKQALLLLKKSLDDSWANCLSSWTGDECCLWDGIECNNLTGHVIHLNLGSCSLKGLIPESIGNLTALRKLDLSDNMIEGYIPKSLGTVTSLIILDLSFNDMQGYIPKSFENLTALSEVDISRNKFKGSIPEFIGSWASLTSLDLSANNFRGLLPQSIGNLSSLTNFRIWTNKVNGSIPLGMGNLTALTDFIVSSNEITGCLPEAFCKLLKLETLDVSYNQLSGSIPECMRELSNLYTLDLQSNSWEGFVSEHHFVNLTMLMYLYISSRSDLVLNISSQWVPPFQLFDLYMNSVKVGPKFPQWLLTQRDIMYIKMQNASISGALLGVPNGLLTLDLSNNRLSGEIPTSLCNMTSLRILLLSNNNFLGELPQCLGNLTTLTAFDVMNNNLSGNIPISLGSLGSLNYLNLHNNKFQGKLPLSFQNLTILVALDVGKNNLTDILPPWSGGLLPFLKFLSLQSNNFYGRIPTHLCHHPSIQVLNLAKNKITGNIPLCFGTFSAMKKGKSDDTFPFMSGVDGETVIDDAKGNDLAYTTSLGFLFSINLSNNNLSGHIPEVLMDLHGLLYLNLAGNHLTGKIPDMIGKLHNLESLDLSRNKLYGSVPQSLSYLNFLSHLDLSFNDLSGRIPTGNQLQTLDDPSIYFGNNQLCGRPILKPCPSDMNSSHDFQDNSKADIYSDDEHMWFYAGIGPGLLVGFLGFCASLHFIKSWRYSYFHYVEQVSDKIAVAIALLWKKLCNLM